MKIVLSKRLNFHSSIFREINSFEFISNANIQLLLSYVYIIYYLRISKHVNTVYAATGPAANFYPQQVVRFTLIEFCSWDSIQGNGGIAEIRLKLCLNL